MTGLAQTWSIFIPRHAGDVQHHENLMRTALQASTFGSHVAVVSAYLSIERCPCTTREWSCIVRIWLWRIVDWTTIELRTGIHVAWDFIFPWNTFLPYSPTSIIPFYLCCMQFKIQDQNDTIVRSCLKQPSTHFLTKFVRAVKAGVQNCTVVIFWLKPIETIKHSLFDQVCTH